MDAAIKKKWIKALRSGRYKQAQAQLYDSVTGGHCCLGVLCRVVRARRDGENFIWKDDRESLDLPSALRVDLGLSFGDVGKLVKMNDDELMNFKQIAAHISKEL
jgi:hypothetical protein